MDEPIFAMEPHQKQKAMEYVTDYARRNALTLYFSLHELDLSRTYSDLILLFYHDRRIRLGPTEELFTRDNIEEAYQIPYAMLKDKEALYREMLIVRTGRD
jgi:iron complex transport system ATP-binding protein